MIDATAIATFALVVVTAVYAFLTWRLAQHSAASARAAQESARNAREAAEATKQAAAIAQAGLTIDFEIGFHEIQVTETERSRWLQITSTGATVYVHSLEALGGGYFRPLGAEDIRFVDGQDARPRQDLPLRLHRGESAHFEWPYEPFELDGPHYLIAQVEYSVDGGGPRHTLTREVTF